MCGSVRGWNIQGCTTLAPLCLLLCDYLIKTGLNFSWGHLGNLPGEWKYNTEKINKGGEGREGWPGWPRGTIFSHILLWYSLVSVKEISRLRTIFNEILHLLCHWRIRWCSSTSLFNPLFLTPFLDTARMEGWMEHWDVMKVFAIYCHSRAHTCLTSVTLDTGANYTKCSTTTTTSGHYTYNCCSFSIHGRWSPADLPNWSESSNAHRQVTLFTWQLWEWFPYFWSQWS